MSSLLERLAEVRKSGDVAKLAEAIPYARWMRIAPENGTGELLTRMRYHDDLIGNTFLPATCATCASSWMARSARP